VLGPSVRQRVPPDAGLPGEAARIVDTGASGPCPYKGLAPFTGADAAYFFGRDDDAERIAACTITSKLTVLVGPSGVGKSSVLGARLPKELEAFVDGTLIVPFVRWDVGFYSALLEASRRLAQRNVATALAEPAESLAEALAGEAFITVQPALQPSTVEELTAALSTCQSIEKLAELWTETVQTPIVFVFDQFEQYFNSRPNGTLEKPGGDGAFAVDLARTVNRRDLNAHVLISLREDALFELNRLRTRLPQILANTVRIEYLDTDAARQAICEPVRRFGRAHPGTPQDIEPELVEALLQAFARKSDPGHVDTPYLQLALERLWRLEAQAGSGWMRYATFEAVGFADGIAKGHFQDTLRTLSAEEQALCASIFHHMLTPSGMKIALPASDLANYADTDAETVEKVLRKLETGTSKIIRSVAAPQGEGGRLYEIFHDVLAAPVLEWKQNFDAECERKELHNRMQQKLDKQRQKIRIQKLQLIAVVSVMGMLLLSAIGVAWAYRTAAQERSKALAAQASQAIEAGDSLAGLELVQKSLPEPGMIGSWWQRPVTDAALDVLVRALYRPLGQRLDGHSDRVSDLAYSDDGAILVTASKDKTARLWDAATGKGLWAVPPLAHDAPVSSASFGGGYLVSTSEAGTGYIWQVAKHAADQWQVTQLAKWDIGAEDDTHLAAISEDGRRIATASYARRIAKVWTWNGRGEPQPAVELKREGGRESHDAGITSIAFDHSGERVVTTSWDKRARIWDAASGKLLQELPARTDDYPYGHAKPVLSAGFNRDGSLVVTSGGDGIARIWKADAKDGAPAPPIRLEGHTDILTSAAFNADGTQVITAGRDGAVRIWDARDGHLLRLLQGPAKVYGIGSVAVLRPDGKQLAVAFSENVAFLWPLGGRSEPLPLRDCGGRVTTAVVSGDDRLLAATFEQSVCLLDVTRGKRLLEARTALPVMSLAFAPATPELALAYGDEVEIRRVQGDPAKSALSLETERRFVGHDGLVLSVAFDRAGKRLITASQDDTARIWSIANGATEVVLHGHRAAVFSAAFSGDGKRAVTGSFDGTIRVWDSMTGELKRSIEVPNGAGVLAVSFAGHDDQFVAATLLQAVYPFAVTTAVFANGGDRAEADLTSGSLILAGRFVGFSGDTGMRLPNGFTVLSENRDTIRSVVGSVSSQGLYALSADGQLRLWPLPPADPEGLITYAQAVKVRRAAQ